MAATAKRAEKISVSVEARALKRAKALAKRSGITLSKFVSDAIELLAQEEERRAIARELVESFPPEARATAVELEAFRQEWATPHTPTRAKRRSSR